MLETLPHVQHEFQSTHPSGVRRAPGSPLSPLAPLFQSTHPSGVRLLHWAWRAPSPNFNPRTPVGCDCRRNAVRTSRTVFQSTHPSGVRPASPSTKGGTRCSISIHAPQWGATIYRSIVFQQYPNFNPRTPVGCDCAGPAGATPRDRFQSTHPSGVRPATSPPCRSRCIDFNPRTPVGCDRFHRRKDRVGQISIHAPQWGATESGMFIGSTSVFQSTHPSGVRPMTPLTSISRSEFQSTHPSGVRQFPASRRGSLRIISIHAPQWGATPRLRLRHTKDRISIHAPQWGATHRHDRRKRRHYISIHAPQWGATTAKCANSAAI